jgi:hypothetical protein
MFASVSMRARRYAAALHDPRYEEPILLALGLAGREQPEEVERLVAEAVFPAHVPSQYEHLLWWDFLFALRVLADDIPLDTVTLDALLRRAIDEWLRGDDSRCRFSRYRTTLADRIAGLGATRAAGRLLAATGALAAAACVSTPRRFCQLAATLSSLGPFRSKLGTTPTTLSGQRPKFSYRGPDVEDAAPRTGGRWCHSEALPSGSRLERSRTPGVLRLRGATTAARRCHSRLRSVRAGLRPAGRSAA